ncbi:MAG TPA: branched-chain amino acid ABC transporter permease [Candidatus Baltobacteraceae bacterium]|nr:branched-chain amino acid ABC transporter permease [Candidatus Baltobacteraceae bacterium]
MQELAQQIVSGLATGSIFASLALALVLIYRSMNVVNFAQGEMAMFSTFIAWQLVQVGVPMWLAFGITLVIAFVAAFAIERVVIRPVERAPQLTIVIVTLGLLIVCNGAAGWIWGYMVRSFPSPFPIAALNVGGVSLSLQDLGVIGVSLVTLLAVYLLFQKTKLGLGLRAAALYPEQSRLMGIRVSRMLAIGWGLAALVGAVSGIMIAPVVFLEPNMMQGVLVYAFAAAVLGGIESPIGAVIGGLLLGVALALLGTYVSFIGTDLNLPVAFGIIVIVLLVRPAGLFGRAHVKRV